MEVKVLRMNTAQVTESLDVAQQRINEVISNSNLLDFVEISRRLDVFDRLGENDNLLQRRRRSFTRATLRNSTFPDSAFA